MVPFLPLTKHLMPVPIVCACLYKFTLGLALSVGGL